MGGGVEGRRSVKGGSVRERWEEEGWDKEKRGKE